MQKDPDTNVDRSRLTLLLGLTSSAAAAGCGPSPRPANKGFTTFDRRQKDPFEEAVDEMRPGGEGGEGGGSH